MIEIRLPKSTIEIERSRPPASMKEDDFRWCVNAEIALSDKQGGKLLIEVPLFYFIQGFVNLGLDSADMSEAELFDLYDAYRLHIRISGDAMIVEDEYGGGRVTINRFDFFCDLFREYEVVVEKLVKSIPDFRVNPDFVRLDECVRSSLGKCIGGD